MDSDSISIPFDDDYNAIELLSFAYSIEGENLTLSNSQSLDEVLPGAIGITEIYFHRVSILENQRFWSMGSNNGVAKNNFGYSGIQRRLIDLQRRAFNQVSRP